MNLLLTNRCNNACRYCFLKDNLLPEEYEGGDMSEENFEIALSFALEMIALEVKEGVNLLGGEPTLHPRFIEFLRRTIHHPKAPDLPAGRIPVCVFTNGLFNETIAKEMALERCGVMLNINEPYTYSEKAWTILNRNLEILRLLRSEHEDNGLTLSLNLYHPKQDVAYMFDLAQKHQIRSLRVDMARPGPTRDNEYIPFAKISEIVPRLTALSQECRDRSMQFISDCCIPVCSCSDSQLKTFMKNGVEPSFSCSGGMDVNYDLEFWYCLPMRGISFGKLTDYKDARHLLEAVEEKIDPLRWEKSSLESCNTCKWKTLHICQGGCLPFKEMG